MSNHKVRLEIEAILDDLDVIEDRQDEQDERLRVIEAQLGIQSPAKTPSRQELRKEEEQAKLEEFKQVSELDREIQRLTDLKLGVKKKPKEPRKDDE